MNGIKIDLSTKQLKAIAKIRDIKGYKNISEDELQSSLTSSKPVKKGKKAVKKGKKTKTNFSKARIEKIRKEFN